MNGDLPKRENKRGGPGWWMDVDGVWRPPSEWPHNDPPLDGWQRDASGSWRSPSAVEQPQIATVRVALALEEEPAPPIVQPARTSTPAGSSSSDARGMLLLTGALGAAAILLAVALVLITSAGADDVAETDAEPAVIFAAETDANRLERQIEVAPLAPAEAKSQLTALESRQDDEQPTQFAENDWSAIHDDCLTITERVLVDRSSRPVTWEDELKCQPDQGSWTDRNLGTEISWTLAADVVPLVPATVAHDSGGFEWTQSTRQNYMSDLLHPATLQIVAKGSGNNPREQDPSGWRPSDRAVWCAYAVDWIAVKSRWELSVLDAERAALAEMLDTCAEPDSAGADPRSMVTDDIPAVQIERNPTE